MQRYENLTREGVKKLAARLAKKYSEQDVVIGLVGQLGAGKTTFVKDFAQNFGIKKIKSPTFIIGSVYKIKTGQLYHYDFYRLNNKQQLRTLGFDEIINSQRRIVLIEWVDKFPKIATSCDLIISFEISGKNLRNVTIR